MTAESTGTAAGRARSSPLARHLPVLVPLAVFGAHATVFGGWLIDDAGISFAYARNLVHGHGLVSQPGVPPVEGYSNFLWVLMVALLYAARLFALPWAAKALAGVLVAAALLAWARPDGIVFAAAYPTWLAMNALAQRRWQQAARALVPYLGGLVPLLAILELFRWWYFGDLVPNTYYAKGGPSPRTVVDLLWLREPLLGKLLDLGQSVVGWRPRVWVLVATLGATAWLGGRRTLGPIHGAVGVMLVAATTVYLLGGSAGRIPSRRVPLRIRSSRERGGASPARPSEEGAPWLTSSLVSSGRPMRSRWRWP